MSERKRVGVFHPGTQHSWQTALALQESGQLTWYATSVFYDPNRWPYRVERFVPRRAAEMLGEEFRRRHTPHLDIGKVRQFGVWEWLEIGSNRLGARRLSKWANSHGNVEFGHLAIKLLKREPVDVVWGYDGSSLEVFRWAKHQGLFCVLDQSIGDLARANRVLLDERERNPEFFHEDYKPELQSAIDRQNEELALADLVIVGSEFCASTLTDGGCPASKIQVVPYGFDAALFPTEPPTRRPLGGRPVEFVFVGAITPRKGIAYLLRAIAKIPPDIASLTLVGALGIPQETFARYADRIKYVPPVMRPEVVGHLTSADCFIFPSLLEGSALVLCEAVGSGLGIIQSAASGDGVRDGRNGMILSDVSVEAVLHAIGAATRDPVQFVNWQRASWRMREERTWLAYRERVRSLPVLQS